MLNRVMLWVVRKYQTVQVNDSITCNQNSPRLTQNALALTKSGYPDLWMALCACSHIAHSLRLGKMPMLIYHHAVVVEIIYSTNNRNMWFKE